MHIIAIPKTKIDKQLIIKELPILAIVSLIKFMLLILFEISPDERISK